MSAGFVIIGIIGGLYVCENLADFKTGVTKAKVPCAGLCLCLSFCRYS